MLDGHGTMNYVGLTQTEPVSYDRADSDSPFVARVVWKHTRDTAQETSSGLDRRIIGGELREEAFLSSVVDDP